jgi:hypothetical protein
VWKTRIDQDPPPNFWADFLANVDVVYPNAKLSDTELRKIYQLVVDEWREGVQLHSIVRQLCSCDDGRTVTASPAAMQRLGKHRKVALPPQGAKRGDVFGLADLRETKVLADLWSRLSMVEAKIRAGDKTASLAKQRQELADRFERAQKDAYWVKRRQEESSPPPVAAKMARPKNGPLDEISMDDNRLPDEESSRRVNLLLLSGMTNEDIGMMSLAELEDAYRVALNSTSDTTLQLWQEGTSGLRKKAEAKFKAAKVVTKLRKTERKPVRVATPQLPITTKAPAGLDDDISDDLMAELASQVPMRRS